MSDLTSVALADSRMGEDEWTTDEGASVRVGLELWDWLCVAVDWPTRDLGRVDDAATRVVVWGSVAMPTGCEWLMATCPGGRSLTP